MDMNDRSGDHGEGPGVIGVLIVIFLGGVLGMVIGGLIGGVR